MGGLVRVGAWRGWGGWVGAWRGWGLQGAWAQLREQAQVNGVEFEAARVEGGCRESEG